VTAGGGEASLGTECADQFLGAGIVDAEGGRGDEDPRPFRLQCADRLPYRPLVEIVRDEKAVGRCEPTAGRQLDRRDPGLRFRQMSRGLSGHGDDADLGHIAFEQGIGRLGGRVRQEHHLLRGRARRLEHGAEHLDDACCDATRMIVRSQNRRATDHLPRDGVDQHCLGKRTADVDANPKGAGHGRGPAGWHQPGKVRAGDASSFSIIVGNPGAEAARFVATVVSGPPPERAASCRAGRTRYKKGRGRRTGPPIVGTNPFAGRVHGPTPSGEA